FPAVHGAPVHIGKPELIGIADLMKPDYGDPVPGKADEIPVFWACGVTPQSAVAAVKPEFCITHYPGSFLVTYRRNSVSGIMGGGGCVALRRRATLRSAPAGSRFWPFRRRPAGKFRNGPRFAATAPRLYAPSTWPCLRARRAPRRAPVRATLCAARRAALALVSWLPPPCARWRASSSRYRTGIRSPAT